MISPLPGATTLKPGSATFPLPGIGAEVVDEAGNPVERGGGYLTLTRPWPSMLRGIYGDPERYHETYWSRYEGRYFAGDGAKIDDDGYLWLLGRVDDVMNVSGHRISTTEVESALVDHPSVAEAAVVGSTDETTGQAIIGYVILRGGNEPTPELGEEVRQHVAKKIGPIARPKTVIFTDELPEDPLRQDHAAPAARRRRGPFARRHDDPRRPGRRRGDQAPRRRVSDRGLTLALVDTLAWRDDPQPPGPAVLVDLDGTLSDAAGRQHFLERRPKDWNGFFDAAADDPLIDQVARLVELLAPEIVVILLTARPVRTRPATLGWLAQHGVRWDLLVMRADGDYRPSQEAKLDAVRALAGFGFDLRLALDDDPRNAAMFRAEGIPCLEIGGA